MPLIQKMLQRSPELAWKPCKGGAGATPLHVAGYIGLSRVAALLLTHGAPPDAATRGGRTPLDEAMYSGHHEIVRLLLGRLSNDAQASARLRIAEYISLPDASLRREELSGIPLPDVPKRRTRIDPAPSDPPGRASCEQGGGWDVKGGLEPPAGSPLAEPSVSALFDHPTIDMRSPDLSASEYYHEYFLKGASAHTERGQFGRAVRVGVLSQGDACCGGSAQVPLRSDRVPGADRPQELRPFQLFGAARSAEMRRCEQDQTAVQLEARPHAPAQRREEWYRWNADGVN